MYLSTLWYLSSKNLFRVSLNPEILHMGQIPQDGNFGQNVVLFWKKKSLRVTKPDETLKMFPRPGQGVSWVQGTQLTKINWKIKDISSGLVTRRLYFFQKRTKFWPKFPSWGIWPRCGSLYQCVLFLYILFLVLPIFEVSVPKSVVPNFGTSYVWCFLLLRSYLCVFLSLCYSINGGAPWTKLDLRPPCKTCHLARR